MLVSASNVKPRIDFSKPSTRRRMRVWESDCQSAVLLSSVIMAACGRRQMRVRELHFRFLSPADQRVCRATVLARVACLPCRMQHEISMAVTPPQLISAAKFDQSLMDDLRREAHP